MPKQRLEMALNRHKATLSGIDTETWAALESVLQAICDDELEAIGSSVYPPNANSHPATEYAVLQRKAGKAEGVKFASTELFKAIDRARKMRYQAK